MQNVFWKVWQIPLLLSVLSLIGLISALTGDEFWDLLSWLTLGIPMLVIVFFAVKHGRAVKR
ncbi:DUF4925 domain-containing protein [Dyadobacter diqingensis]|uniref:DUF4925 domain-containing protein n=1 Tax=Dyadobacter diqingensis TaxID=2938121 RepID=UPI0020C1B4B6|nr:DUF4925 domain-containing protein [Dyadobacter diqingensis]